jgi:hypothetical protein
MALRVVNSGIPYVNYRLCDQRIITQGQQHPVRHASNPTRTVAASVPERNISVTGCNVVPPDATQRTVPAGTADTLTLAAPFDRPLSVHDYISFDFVLDVNDGACSVSRPVPQSCSRVRRQHLARELTRLRPRRCACSHRAGRLHRRRGRFDMRASVRRIRKFISSRPV